MGVTVARANTDPLVTRSVAAEHIAVFLAAAIAVIGSVPTMREAINAKRSV
jgi:hypothetical protein